ncbi:general odorant-binding protein 70 isoform X4 [Bactrocera neohumeralis]|uniref:general odorant-binding protein 70 isoform X4 n=1 Tax=Bactrocera tryoni TaxID=59916 RepID=UPI001A98A93A|nr:general odorant-binding protein 70 isoform X4 [Bactrocera tryoni]XP_050336774.1 general odorant-binding protein 70 isoform X4 [Bactrocera neohumeralis]
MISNVVYRAYIALILLDKSGILAKDSHSFTKVFRYKISQFNRCLNPPRTARRVESFIQECQEDVKNKLISEAYYILKSQVKNENTALDITVDNISEINSAPAPVPVPSIIFHTIEENSKLTSQHDAYQFQPERQQVTSLMHHIRRISYNPRSALYYPTLVPAEEKRLAGCLLHCVYAKNNAIDKLGWPTLDGLVNFYSEGVNEHGFFMATLRSVNLCLHAITIKYNIDRRKLPKRGESCDLAFDVFDCISDQLTGYCLNQYE